jgi:hypothetical protein
MLGDEDLGDQPSELTFEMKAQLNHDANSLSSKDLYGMVGIIEVRLPPPLFSAWDCSPAHPKRLRRARAGCYAASGPSAARLPTCTPLSRSQSCCKKAVDQTDAAEIEIDIDTLDLPTFIKVEKYVQDCLARQKKKSK